MEKPSPRRATRWLSQGFEVLAARLDGAGEAVEPYDVVVIGSGYGGAVAAAEFSACVDSAGKPLCVCVLERGREYLPGAFPTRAAELAGHVRFSTAGRSTPRGRREGLFDLRLSDDLSALVANGLGGGSLINAGVIEPPDDAALRRSGWPGALRRPRALRRWLDAAAQRLGASHGGRPNTLDTAPPAKQGALMRLHPKQAKKVPLSIALGNAATSSAGIALNPCERCGDCATGCNFGAKESLDLNLLAQARRQGAELYTGATALWLERGDDGLWTVVLNHTDETLRRRQRQGGRTPHANDVFRLPARRVVLAAGTFGSTELLLRSAKAKKRLDLSPMLGHKLSGNGDMLAVVSDLGVQVDGIADERQAPAQRNVGPTITAMIDQRAHTTGAAGDSLVIQEMAVPGPLRRLWEESVALATTFDDLARCDRTTHRRSDTDPCAVDPQRTARSMLVAMMGHDGADGRLELLGGAEHWQGDGALKIVWPNARHDPRLARRHDRLDALRQAAFSQGRTLANPLWRALPGSLDGVLGDTRGPLFTVHPLGGCPMGDGPTSGVVDHIGRVFRGRPGTGESPFHDGLVVLDGAIVPTSLGINPAGTITALALRAARHLRRHWGLHPARPHAAPHDLGPRPVFRSIDPQAVPPATRDTEVGVAERLKGWVTLKDTAGTAHRLHAELTLHFQPRPIARLTDPDPALRCLEIDPARSRLRLFRTPPRLAHVEADDARALWIGPIERGTLHLFQREPTQPQERLVRAAAAWGRNRGLRDTALYALDRLAGRLPPEPNPETWRQLAKRRGRETLRLATRAGERRLLRYDLTLGAALPRPGGAPAFALDGCALRGRKTLTYACRANPWRQLSRVTLDASPFDGAPALELDLHAIVRGPVPLLRIEHQHDQPSALIDLAGFALYVARLLISVHAWSFRKPDAPPERRIDRLPGAVPGLPAPQVTELAVEPPSDRTGAVHIRLTRYANPGGLPVVMIHGYSASGTTFAHHTVRPGLAQFLWERGRDVWIVDLRSSAGMPTAREPWSFERVGFTDIPPAIDHVCRVTGEKQVDVIAHCMGSAMLCMALLDKEKFEGAPGLDPRPERGGDPPEPFYELRMKLPQRIRRLVLSQVGPATVYSPANTLRAYLMNYLRQYLDLEGYEFRPPASAQGGARLLDRLLATLPYPDAEFDLENPWPSVHAVPWTGTRHRMDALYGRDFSAANLSPGVLDHLDDHFGPLSLVTVAQAIQFARFRTLADRTRTNRFVSPESVGQRMQFPVMSVHGADNGLVDWTTLVLMHRLMLDARARGRTDPYVRKLIRGHGHQDCLIGRDAATAVFPAIARFLESP